MIYNVSFPNGGTNKMWEPMHISAQFPGAHGLTIQGKTYTRDGCTIILLDEHGQEIKKYIQEGYSIYIQYGATHAVMQESFLREDINNDF